MNQQSAIRGEVQFGDGTATTDKSWGNTAMKRIFGGMAALTFGTAVALTGGSAAHASVRPASCFVDTEETVGATGVFTECPGYYNPTAVTVVTKDTKADAMCADSEIDWYSSAGHIIHVDVTSKVCKNGTTHSQSFSAPSGAYYTENYTYEVS